MKKPAGQRPCWPFLCLRPRRCMSKITAKSNKPLFRKTSKRRSCRKVKGIHRGSEESETELYRNAQKALLIYEGY